MKKIYDFESWPKDKLVEFLMECKYPGVTYREIEDRSDYLRLKVGNEPDHIVTQASRVKSDLEITELDSLIGMCQRALADRTPEIISELKEQQMFFNRTESATNRGAYSGNIDNWTAKDQWSEDEAIALSLDKDPERVNWDSIKNYLDKSPFAQKYSSRRKQLKGGLKKSELKPPLVPTQFIQWCVEKTLDIPPELQLLLEESETKAAEKSRIESPYWLKLEGLVTTAIREYPEWREKQQRYKQKIQKTGSLISWLKNTIGANHREAEIIKKILTETFPELR